MNGNFISYDGLTPMQRGRLDKALGRVFRFSSGIMSLGEYLEEQTLIGKSAYTRHYALKKGRNLCYDKLAKPKTHHTALYMKDGREWGIEIPKIVYDALVNLPARVSEE